MFIDAPENFPNDLPRYEIPLFTRRHKTENFNNEIVRNSDIYRIFSYSSSFRLLVVLLGDYLGLSFTRAGEVCPASLFSLQNEFYCD